MIYLVINEQFKVSITDDEDVAELLSGEDGSVIELPSIEDVKEDSYAALTHIFQTVVDVVLQQLDDNRERIAAQNRMLSKNNKGLN